MSNTDTPVDMRPAEIHDAADDVPDAPTRTFAQGLDVLSSILGNSKLGQLVQGTWHCKRLEVDFPYHSLTPDQFEKLNADHTVRQRIGKTATIHSELDNEAYNLDVIKLACEQPNFNDATTRRQIAEKVGKPSVNDALGVIKIVLLPGEIARFSNAVLSSSGFEEDEETIQAVKG